MSQQTHHFISRTDRVLFKQIFGHLLMSFSLSKTVEELANESNLSNKYALESQIRQYMNEWPKDFIFEVLTLYNEYSRTRADQDLLLLYINYFCESIKNIMDQRSFFWKEIGGDYRDSIFMAAQDMFLNHTYEENRNIVIKTLAICHIMQLSEIGDESYFNKLPQLSGYFVDDVKYSDLFYLFDILYSESKNLEVIPFNVLSDYVYDSSLAILTTNNTTSNRIIPTLNCFLGCFSTHIHNKITKDSFIHIINGALYQSSKVSDEALDRIYGLLELFSKSYYKFLENVIKDIYDVTLSDLSSKNDLRIELSMKYWCSLADFEYQLDYSSSEENIVMNYILGAQESILEKIFINLEGSYERSPKDLKGVFLIIQSFGTKEPKTVIPMIYDYCCSIMSSRNPSKIKSAILLLAPLLSIPNIVNPDSKLSQIIYDLFDCIDSKQEPLSLAFLWYINEVIINFQGIVFKQSHISTMIEFIFLSSESNIELYEISLGLLCNIMTKYNYMELENAKKDTFSRIFGLISQYYSVIDKICQTNNHILRITLEYISMIPLTDAHSFEELFSLCYKKLDEPGNWYEKFPIGMICETMIVLIRRCESLFSKSASLVVQILENNINSQSSYYFSVLALINALFFYYRTEIDSYTISILEKVSMALNSKDQKIQTISIISLTTIYRSVSYSIADLKLIDEYILPLTQQPISEMVLEGIIIFITEIIKVGKTEVSHLIIPICQSAQQRISSQPPKGFVTSFFAFISSILHNQKIQQKEYQFLYNVFFSIVKNFQIIPEQYIYFLSIMDHSLANAKTLVGFRIMHKSIIDTLTVISENGSNTQQKQSKSIINILRTL